MNIKYYIELHNDGYIRSKILLKAIPYLTQTTSSTNL